MTDSIVTDPAAGPVEPSRKRPPIAGRQTVSNQLRAVMRSWGLTPYAIAVRADVDPKVIARFLDDDPAEARGLTLATVDRIGAAFNLRIGQGVDRVPVGKAKRRPGPAPARG